MKKSTDTINSNKIINLICNYYGEDIKDVISRSRERNLVICRQFIHFFLRKKTNMSFYKIGDLTNNNHSTVMYSNKIIDNLQMYKEFKMYKDHLSIKVNKLIKTN